ncbi:MAG: hypothetical protein U9Q12_04185 [Patescibacteria group bacterium]|nr:hypothetical protein [Patescibacteria group bacterium]
MQLVNIAQAGPLDTAPKLSSLVTSVLQFVVTLVGVIAVLVIIVAGIMYMTSGGDTARVQTAKKALWAGVIGLSIAILSLIIVKTIVSFV